MPQPARKTPSKSATDAVTTASPRADDKARSKSEAKAGGKAADKASDKAGDKASDKAGDKVGDKAGVKAKAKAKAAASATVKAGTKAGAEDSPAAAAPRISRFPVPEISSLPEDIRDRILGVQEKAGFVPNVFLVLAHRPDEFRAFFAYHDALMDKPGNLSKAEREMIVVATSNANQCQYCVVAHGAILRVRAKDPLIADQVAINYRKADITARQRAMLDFGMKVSQAAQAVNDEDFEVLSSHGFTEDDIWDIAAISSFFGLSNRMANVTSMRPNAEFFAMGR